MSAFAELGLPARASEREIKAAWRRLVSQWHPDRNPSAEAVLRMQRINRAFDAIREAGFTEPMDWEPFAEPEAPRAARRRARSAEAHEPPPRRARPGASARTRKADKAEEAQEEAEPAEDAQESPDAAEPAGDARRAPIVRRMRLTLEEAAAGCVKVLRGKFAQPCADCRGAGHHVLEARCRRCNGTGQQTWNTFFGWPGSRRACEACGGTGQVRQACAACEGSGSVSQAYQVKVRIPPGVRPGDQLHVARTRAGAQAPPADLDIRVEWLPHPFFELDDDGTLRCEVPVDGFAWVAQREVPVPTLAGLRPLPLRREQLRYVLPGQGFPARGQATGPRPDQVLMVRPVFPERPSADQQVLLEQLMATTAADAPPALRAWRRQIEAWSQGH